MEVANFEFAGYSKQNNTRLIKLPYGEISTKKEPLPQDYLAKIVESLSASSHYVVVI